MKSSFLSLLKSRARPAPATRSPEEFTRLFTRHRHAVYRNLDLFGMNFIQLCFPMLYAKCRAGYRAEARPEFLLVSNDRRHYVLPLTDDWQTFMRAVTELVGRGGRVMAFPKVDTLRGRPGRYPEYVCETELLADMPGRRLKTYRRDARRIEESGVRFEEGSGSAEELYEMNARWYSEFEERKGFRAERFAESEAIISLSGVAPEDKDLLRVFRAVVPAEERTPIPDDGRRPASAERAARLGGFLITCRLSETYWAAVLSRSLSEWSGLGHYMWHKAAQVYLKEGVPLENDNTGGFDPALCAYKQRFSSGLIYPYQLWSKWLSGFR